MAWWLVCRDEPEIICRRALGGTISSKLGDLGYLATVSLHTNNLTGQIPAELFKASALARVYLSENDLTGAIPPEIRNLGQQLRVLELRGNRLTSLPPEIISCYRLRRLILSSNNITGTIPFGMGSQFTQLERLDLSGNRFTGAIPDDFGNLTSLQPQVHESLTLMARQNDSQIWIHVALPAQVESRSLRQRRCFHVRIQICCKPNIQCIRAFKFESSVAMFSSGALMILRCQAPHGDF
jgi:hypothetical protein